MTGHKAYISSTATETTAKATQLTELKKRALLAKQRMRMGYWQSITAERTKKLDELGTNIGTSVQLVQQLQRAQVLRDENIALGAKDTIEEEKFYTKVCALLDGDEVITNPIGALAEPEVLKNLDEGNRQKYILDLSKKFCAMKARYYSERTMARAY